MKNMKILVIMGSPRKGNTFSACEELRESMKEYLQADFEYLWLKDADLAPCKGCLACFSDGEDKCPNRDDAPEIARKMDEADGVVFATPVYGMNVSGQMKIFIDRFCYNFHRPRFFGKSALLLVTTGFMGEKKVLNYLGNVAWLWGFEIAGKAGLVTMDPLPKGRKEKNRKGIAKAAGDFASAIGREITKKPGLKDIIIFHGERASFSRLEKISPGDYRYWKEKGWLDRSTKYFTGAPVNPVYHWIGVVAEFFAGRQVEKELTLEDDS